MTRCVGIRGATTVDDDDLEQILDATQDLLERLRELNDFTPDDLASIFFTTTPDLRATFPARAARRLGWTQVPMMCAQEIASPSAVPRCIRVMMHWNTDKPLAEVRHAYLRGSRVLRPDWAIPPLGGAVGQIAAPERPAVEQDEVDAAATEPAVKKVAPRGRPAPTGALDIAPVAVLGGTGSFSHEAALAAFGDDLACVPAKSFRAVWDAVHVGRARSALLPVENSTTGSIFGAYDLLLNHDLTVVAELVLPVRHALLVRPEVALADIREVVSHPQPLLQCESWIANHGWQKRAVSDTASAAELVAAADPSEGLAAVGSRVAAAQFGLQVLAADIQDVPENYTRFLLLMPSHAVPAGSFAPGVPYEGDATPLKTSLIFATRHVAGDLYGCLAEFAVREINLTRIESRPNRRTPWNYLFYLDFEGHAADAKVSGALRALARHASFIRVLGSFPSRQL